jgi:cobalamin 5'-phosphate synthase/cobalamin synthase
VRRLLVATAFLTRLPVPARGAMGAAEVGRATVAFPVVGAALGAVLAGAGGLLARALPAQVAAVLVVALEVVLTGALHLDGLADTADGLGGGRDAAHALQIMRDHAVGAYGGIALALALLLRVTAVAVLLAGAAAWVWLPVAGALARWILVLLARYGGAARPDGLGASVAAAVGVWEVAGASALAVGLAVALAGALGLVALGAVGLSGLLLALLCRRRVGGMTGDTLGAAAELAIAIVLVIGVAGLTGAGRAAP